MSNPSDPGANPPSPPETMLQMIAGFWVSRLIHIAAKLGLADLVKEEPKTAEALAAATGTHAPSLYRVLRALASTGIFAEDAEGRFAQTPLSDTLRSDVYGSLRAMAMVELGQEHFPAWGNLMHSVKTGEIAFDNQYKQNVWEYYAQNPEDASNFNNEMTGLTQMVDHAVLSAYDFSGFAKVVDVAGGVGGLLGAILQQNPGASGVLFDLPHVIAEAGPLLDQADVRDRCELTSGDFFQAVPAGGDAYTLKFILHDWDDGRCVKILNRIRAAMNPDGKLLVIETVVPPGNEPSFSKFMDLNMLVITGGCERTEAEFAALFASTGFKLTRVVPTPSFFNVIEAVRA